MKQKWSIKPVGIDSSRLFGSFENSSEDRPDVLLLDSLKGVIAVEISDSGTDDQNLRVRLNRKITSTLQDFSELENVPVNRILVFSSSRDDVGEIPKSTLLLSRDEYSFEDWIARLPEKTIDIEELKSLALRFHPVVEFETVAFLGVEDERKAERASIRFSLDAEQAKVAQLNTQGVLLITGPPGSGKTLALVARARWLSSLNPDWNISLICYNRSLETYLSRLVADIDNVTVFEFYLFQKMRGGKFKKIPFSKNSVRQDLKKSQEIGIPQDLDAILIDEWQDFEEDWITYCMESLAPGRAGMTLAGDEKQGLYEATTPIAALKNKDVTKVELKVPYRSTRQILEFTALLDEEFDTEGRELAMDGPPVELIRAGSWDEQAEVVVLETMRMIDSKERDPDQIAIICSRKTIRERVLDLLKEKGVPHKVLGDNSDPKNIENSFVSVSTIHSSKGFEFDVVFCLGLDVVKPIAGSESPQKSRIAYVGPTRARDQLIVTYTKSTPVIGRLGNAPKDLVNQWIYPDDFKVGE